LGIKMEEAENVHDVEPFYRSGNGEQGKKVIRREGEEVECRFSGGEEAAWTAWLLRSGTRCGGASTSGRQPRWVAATLSREEDDGAGGLVNGPKDQLGYERCWPDFRIENDN
jgi:hypothetical protein